ncbi:MAG: heavy metal-responsive transcriptional regulator [Chloroflexi bacterium]|nr:heavy metal-responsive transcriptional regulator [Chloroflexota bacterium]
MKDSVLIGELSRRLGIPAHTIRYYEGLGLLPPPARAGNRYRVYSSEHEERLQFIQKAKRFGFSLDEIKALLAIRAGGNLPCEEVKRLTKMHLDELNDRIDRMLAFRDELLERYRKLETAGAAPGLVCGLIEGKDSS